MISEGEVSEQLQRFVRTKISGAFTGKVTKNNDAETKAMVEVEFNDFTYDVRLKSIVDESEQHFLLVPKVNSQVFCISEGNSQERFVAVSLNEIEKLICKIGETSIIVSETGIVFNNAALNSYMADINKLVEKVNVIEQSLNTVKNIFKAWMPVAQDGGAKLKTDITAWANQTITQTRVGDIKDEKIQH